MPSYIKRKTKKGDVFDCRFRIIEHGKPVHKSLNGYVLKKEAKAAYEDFMYKYEATQKPADTLSFAELFECYKQHISTRYKESSIISITRAIERHILPYFKNFVIDSISKKDINEWQDWMNSKSKVLSYAYKSRVYGYFVTLMNYAVEEHNLIVNPLTKAKNFKNLNEKVEMSFWTEDEFTKFIKSVDKIEYKTLFSFLYLTGARRGETLALTWKDVSDDAVNINKTCTFQTNNGSFVITTPKTKSSYRKILLPNSLIKLLEDYKLYCKKFDGFSEKSYIFGISTPLPPETIRRYMRKYCQAAGIKVIRIHDFRHAHASLLINKGQNILSVAKRLGHSNIEQTLNTYSHFFDSEQKKLLESINIDV